MNQEELTAFIATIAGKPVGLRSPALAFALAESIRLGGMTKMELEADVFKVVVRIKKGGK